VTPLIWRVQISPVLLILFLNVFCISLSSRNQVTVGSGFPVTLAVRVNVDFGLTVVSSNFSVKNGAWVVGLSFGFSSSFGVDSSWISGSSCFRSSFGWSLSFSFGSSLGFTSSWGFSGAISYISSAASFGSSSCFLTGSAVFSPIVTTVLCSVVPSLLVATHL